MEGLRFFSLVQIMDAMRKQNGHGDTSSDTAVSLKKGDFITPSVNPFFQKENGGLISFQTAVRPLIF